MRKVLMAVAGVVLGAAPAMAVGNGLMAPDWATGPDDSVHHVKVNRYVFNLAGNQLDPARVCNGTAVSSVREYRESRDWAYAVFSLGWYLPRHADIVCGAAGGERME